MYHFGQSVAVSGPIAVVGSPGLGYVYVYTIGAKGWHGDGRLRGRDSLTTDDFGASGRGVGPDDRSRCARHATTAPAASTCSRRPRRAGSRRPNSPEATPGCTSASAPHWRYRATRSIVGEPAGHSRPGEPSCSSSRHRLAPDGRALRSGHRRGNQFGNAVPSLRPSPSSATRTAARDLVAPGSGLRVHAAEPRVEADAVHRRSGQPLRRTVRRVRVTDGYRMVVGAPRAAADGLGRVYLYSHARPDWSIASRHARGQT